jgi:hypothetical protein
MNSYSQGQGGSPWLLRPDCVQCLLHLDYDYTYAGFPAITVLAGQREGGWVIIPNWSKPASLMSAMIATTRP